MTAGFLDELYDPSDGWELDRPHKSGAASWNAMFAVRW